MDHKHSKAREISRSYSRPARLSRAGYKTVTVTVLDMARLLDWCANSHMHADDGTVVEIDTLEWYREAYEQASSDFAAAL